MVQKIQYTDNLKEGTDKLNQSIDQSNDAILKSNNADQKSTQALNNSVSTQTQLDNIVVEGDSSVEAAQARVDSKGESFPTLKSRIDNFEISATAQLQQTENQLFQNAATGRLKESLNDVDLLNLRINHHTFYADVTMPTSPYGNTEYVHPDVIYSPQGWNGFKYWMAVNPYKDSSYAYENPCMYVSNDSINWQEAPGVTNPLYPMPSSPGGMLHYSDPVWLLDKNGYTLHYIHRLSGDGNDNVYYMMSSDNGVDWTQQEEIYRVSGRDIVSPSIIYNNDKYYMYYIDITTDYSMHRVESLDLFNWTNEVSVPYNGASKIWHFDIIEYGGGLIMAACDPAYQKIMLYKSRDFISFDISSDNLINFTDVGNRRIYKPDILLFNQSGDINLLLLYNLMPTTDKQWEFKQARIPLTQKVQIPQTNPTFKVMYGSLTGQPEGDVPLSRSSKFHINYGDQVTMTFRLDFGNLDSIPSARDVVITLPIDIKKTFEAYFTFPIWHTGTAQYTLIGILNTETKLIHLRKLTANGYEPVKTQDLGAISSIRGSVTYLNNLS